VRVRRLDQCRSQKDSLLCKIDKCFIKKYQHMPEVNKIHAARKAPKFIKKKTEVVQVQKESQQRKQANRAKYDKTGTEQFVSDRKKVVVKKID
jgi:hypothetical protein